MFNYTEIDCYKNYRIAGRLGGRGACYERDITTLWCHSRPSGRSFISVSFLISPYLESDDYRNVPVLSLFDLRSHQIVPDIILSFSSV